MLFFRTPLTILNKAWLCFFVAWPLAPWKKTRPYPFLPRPFPSYAKIHCVFILCGPPPRWSVPAYVISDEITWYHVVWTCIVLHQSYHAKSSPRSLPRQWAWGSSALAYFYNIKVPAITSYEIMSHRNIRHEVPILLLESSLGVRLVSSTLLKKPSIQVNCWLG